MKRILLLAFCWSAVSARAQFPPPAGQPGSTAIHKDSSVFVGWAKSCTVVRGPKDVSEPSLGFVSVGDSTSALGPAGENGVVSLGDGGYAILTFDPPIADGPGWDFAVFENAFNDTFLELAFVEVSSDGVNFVRFPATSLTQDTVQIGTFGSVDATLIDNLAGKYRAGYGTPFDLQQLAGVPGLDVMSVTHVRVIDVVGSINPNYATYDQYGHKVNDPWPTPFDGGGFDLDAVGVIHTAPAVSSEYGEKNRFVLHPNPARGVCWLRAAEDRQLLSVALYDASGRSASVVMSALGTAHWRLSLPDVREGIYFLRLTEAQGETLLRLVVTP